VEDSTSPPNVTIPEAHEFLGTVPVHRNPDPPTPGDTPKQTEGHAKQAERHAQLEGEPPTDEETVIAQLTRELEESKRMVSLLEGQLDFANAEMAALRIGLIILKDECAGASGLLRELR
jgi:hypothetical protein